MVVTKMRWAADGGDDDDDLRLPGAGRPSPSLGILAFEAASTMTKLLSLHRSLSEKEVARLRSNAMRAAGVEYLSSTDQAFLLRLACAEAVAALDDAAAAVARIGVQYGLDFAGPYASLKAGAPDARLDQFVAKGLKVKAKKMERLVAATAKLCTEMEALNELEAAEQKLARRGWGRLSGPIPSPSAARDGVGSDSLRLDIRAQRARVRRLKEESLWSQSYEKAVILMARAACAVFVRVCVVFGAHVAGLPPPLPPVDAVHTRLSKLLLHPMSAAAAAAQPKSLSGPIQRRDVPLRIEMSSNSCPIIRSHWQQPWQTSPPGLDWRKLLEPPPGTVGSAGLDLQYANVITTAERLLVETEGEGRRHEEARAELYAMLPSKLRAAVRAKLRGWWRERAGGGGGPVLELDAGLAEGWRSAAGRILAWLAPMAQDTARWHAERSMDRQRRFEVGGGGARTWALQTLRWADAEKAEAAVVEVLVALSCVGWYEKRRRVASPRF